MKPDETHTQNDLVSILVAEDDLEMRKLLSWSLLRRGYNVVECADGMSLMRKLGLLGPGDPVQHHDLIIADVRMPGMTGLQVLESVREFPGFPPMILITAFPDSESREQAMRLGAAAMLTKPFDLEELIDRVHDTIPAEPAQQQRGTGGAGKPPFPFEITFRHDAGSEAARDYIESIAAHLHPFADHIVNGRIVVDQSDGSQHKKHRYTVTLVLWTSGKPIIVKYNTDRGASHESLYMAINVTFGTASRRLKHYVKRRQERRKHATHVDPFRETDEVDGDGSR